MGCSTLLLVLSWTHQNLFRLKGGNMIKIKYNLEISEDTLHSNVKRIINQVYKLLPLREQGQDWEKLLSTILQELSGMSKLLFDREVLFFQLLCKLEGLFALTEEDDFLEYRRIIFECLSLLTELNDYVQH